MGAKSQLIVAGTGHRPDKLGGYGPRAASVLFDLAFYELKYISPDAVISGMAIGWDQALAAAALHIGVPLWAYVPFRGQEVLWPPSAQRAYKKILNEAESVDYICDPGFAAWKMQERNKAMVDDCTKVLALWDGSAGGTGNCVKYANRQGKPVLNCWSRFLEMRL